MIILDIDTGSRQEIVAFEGDNTKELTTIALVKDNNRIDLTGKTIDMGYSEINSQGVGDIIENITISNTKQGEISLPINSNLTKKDGFYNCAFKITGEGGYKKFTAPFRLWIKANLFNAIGKAILDNDSFSKIQEILNKADSCLSKLETFNITDVENNIDKATELNNTLTSNVASVDSKNKVLQDSIKAAEDFSKTLQGGTDFVQMRKDIDTLENNLKDTQSLAYSGSNITCNNSLEGRTSGLKLYGKTLYKRKDGTYTDTWEEGCTLESCGELEGNKISILSNGKNFLPPFEEWTLSGNTKLTGKNEVTQIQTTVWMDKIESPFISVFEGNYKLTCTTGLTDYKYQLQMRLYNFKKEQIGGIVYVDKTTLNFDSGVAYIKLSINSGASLSGTFIFKDWQLEKDIQTQYSEYKADKKEIQLQQPLRGLETIQDAIEETSEGVVLTQNIGKIVLNGTENWIRRNMGLENETIGFGILNTEINNYKIDGEGKCDKFIFVKNSNVLWNIDKEGFCCTDFLQLRIKKSELETQDIQGFKQYLKANPITVYYQLAEPKTYILKGIEEIDVDTYNIITYVKSLNTIPCVIDFSIATNYGSLLMQHSQEINRIWDTINNILAPAIAEVAERSVKTSMNLLSLK